MDPSHNVDYEEDLDQIDFNNYKGMFYNDEPGQKYQDEVTGAHFEHHDMCKRLQRLQKDLQQFTQTIDSNEEESEDGSKAKLEQKQIERHTKGLNSKDGKALLLIQELLSHNKGKESRNAVHALPQQGYGTTGAFLKDGNKAYYGEPKNFRQFSSQLGPQIYKDTSENNANKFTKAIFLQGPNRSKSTDKQRSFMGQRDIVAYSGIPIIKPHNVNTISNAKKKSFLDL